MLLEGVFYGLQTGRAERGTLRFYLLSTKGVRAERVPELSACFDKITVKVYAWTRVNVSILEPVINTAIQKLKGEKNQ